MNIISIKKVVAACALAVASIAGTLAANVGPAQAESCLVWTKDWNGSGYTGSGPGIGYVNITVGAPSIVVWPIYKQSTSGSTSAGRYFKYVVSVAPDGTQTQLNVNGTTAWTRTVQNGFTRPIWRVTGATCTA